VSADDATTPEARIVLATEARRCERFLDGRLEVRSPHGVQTVDALLLSALDQRPGGRILVVRSRQGLVGLAIARLFPEAEVHAFDLDSFERHRAVTTARLNDLRCVRFLLRADLPRSVYDWIFLPALRSGDARLSGELVRQTFHALKDRGKLLAATDNQRDRWLHDRIRDVFGDATIHRRSKAGTIYVARRRPGREPRERDFRRTFTGRLFGHTIELESRPGVFSHGRVDDGTLSLADVATLEPDSRVLDLGCGSGALGTAAALTARRGYAVLVDSHARAVEAARATLARNGASRNSLVILGHDLSSLSVGSVDVVLANPPYFGDYRILEHFTRESRRILAPEGVYYCVTKTPDRAEEIVRRHFEHCERTMRRSYAVLRCSGRKGT
jgi:16S rRNA G1207 methylase RsmC